MKLNSSEIVVKLKNKHMHNFFRETFWNSLLDSLNAVYENLYTLLNKSFILVLYFNVAFRPYIASFRKL